MFLPVFVENESFWHIICIYMYQPLFMSDEKTSISLCTVMEKYQNYLRRGIALVPDSRSNSIMSVCEDKCVYCFKLDPLKQLKQVQLTECAALSQKVVTRLP